MAPDFANELLHYHNSQRPQVADVENWVELGIGELYGDSENDDLTEVDGAN